MSKTRTKQQNGGKGGFRETFASARQAGKKTFAYRGKKYTTETAEEKAKTMKPSKLADAVMKSERKHDKNPTKSTKEVYDSYNKGMQKRFNKDYDKVNRVFLLGPKELDKKYGKK